MTVKTIYFRGDIYKNDKNAELRCCPSPIKVGLEQIDKTYKIQKHIQILKLGTWSKKVIENTWLVEDILFHKKSYFIGQNQNLDFVEQTIKWGEWEILRLFMQLLNGAS